MGFLGSGLKLIPSTCATTCATNGRTARAHARHKSTRTAMRDSRRYYTPHKSQLALPQHAFLGHRIRLLRRLERSKVPMPP
jgi:hypothetical protein